MVSRTQLMIIFLLGSDRLWNIHTLFNGFRSYRAGSYEGNQHIPEINVGSLEYGSFFNNDVYNTDYPTIKIRNKTTSHLWSNNNPLSRWKWIDSNLERSLPTTTEVDGRLNEEEERDAFLTYPVNNRGGMSYFIPRLTNIPEVAAICNR